MSRIGLNPINLPEGVTVSVQGSNINVRGPKGEINQKFDPDFKISIDDNILTIKTSYAILLCFKSIWKKNSSED